MLSSVVLPTPLRPIRHASEPDGHLQRHAEQDLGAPVGDVEVARSRALTATTLRRRLDGDAGALVARAAEVDLAHRRDRPAPRRRCPRCRTLPSCSTVTERAKRRRNAMSCSITTTVWSPASSCEQLAGGLALRAAHAGDRLVEQQQLRLLHEQHPDLQPLLLAVAERRRPAGRAWSRSPIRSSVARHAVADALAPAQHPAAAPKRYVSARSRFSTTVSDSNTVGVWKLRPMPERAPAWPPTRRRAAGRRT